jgi:hypothetical protein
MNNPPPLPRPAREYLDDPRRISTPSRLPRSMLRSRAPGYLLATVAVLAIGGSIAWKVAGQARAIHTAETKAAAITATEPDTTPVPVLVDVPSGSPAAEGVPISRLGTTGAVVATPAATATEAVGASVPVTSLPKAKPTTAPELATDSSNPKPHAVHATPHRSHSPHTVHRRPETPPVDQPDRAAGSDSNPYSSDQAPSPAASAPPADTGGIFDLRE